MSHPTDLLPYGELLADAGLIARLLDDGGLSLAEDDTLPDEARVVLSGRPEGLSATLRLFPCEDATTELLGALEDLNTGGPEFFWEDGFVGCGEILPWTANHEFPLADLRSLFTRVARGVDKRPELEATLATPSAEAPLPPSFLPGTGQADRAEGVTQRYGSIGATPGRAEVEAGEVRYATGRHQHKQEGGSNKAVVLVALGTLVFLSLGAAVVIFMVQRSTGFGPDLTASPTPTPTQPQATPADTPADDPVDEPVDEPEAQPKRSRSPRVVKKTDPYVLAASVNAAERLDGLKRWKRKKLDLGEGARLKMLTALDGRQDREQTLIVLRSIRTSAPDVLEAIDCLDRVTSGSPIWRELVEQFGRRELDDDERDVLSDILKEATDTQDLLVEETLVRIGRAKPGAGERLLKSRGASWLEVGGGKDLFTKLPLEQQAALLESDDSKVRVLGAEMIGEAGREGDSAAAVKVLSKHLMSEDEDLKHRAIEEIGSLGEGVAAWYLALAMMRETDRRSSELLRNAMARLPSKEAISFLKKLAVHKSADRRKAAIAALRVIRHPDSIEIMLKGVKDKDRKVRLESLEALANLARDSEHRAIVGKGVLDYRRIAKDRSDPDARRLARQLCLAIDGRLPK